MKYKIIDGLQIILAVIITGSTAFAMQPPQEPPVVQTEKQVAQVVKVEEPAPEPQEKAVEAPKEAEPIKVAEAPKKAAVAAPVQSQPTSKDDILAAAGIDPSDYDSVHYIFGKESGWCATKWEGEYGACPEYHGVPTSPNVGYGLCQSTPANKMASAGDDWATNPVTQLKWCAQYAKDRYGGWKGAANFWTANRWW